VTSHEIVLFEDSFEVTGGAFESAGQTSTHIKALLTKMKLPRDVVRRAAIVAYEAEMNICSYAEGGTIRLRVTPDEIVVEATDKGPGIPDIPLAMKEGYSTATEKIWRMGFGAGMGLRNMKHFSDQFAISSEVGKGTRVTMSIRRHGDVPCKSGT
jgi:serine/threonine-protein kinase RsbT